MQFDCPKCKARLSATPQSAGQIVACPNCKMRLRMPGSQAPLPVAPAQTSPIQTPVSSSPSFRQPLAPANEPYLADSVPGTSRYRQPSGQSKNLFSWLFTGIIIGTLMILLIGIGLTWWGISKNNKQNSLPTRPSGAKTNFVLPQFDGHSNGSAKSDLFYRDHR